MDERIKKFFGSEEELIITTTPPTIIPYDDPLLQFFECGHLPEELQALLAPYHCLAAHVLKTLPESEEKRICMAELINSRNMAMLAHILSQ